MGTERRKLSAKALVTDIRSQISKQELMQKYALSEEQLPKIMAQLVQKGALTEIEGNTYSFIMKTSHDRGDSDPNISEEVSNNQPSEPASATVNQLQAWIDKLVPVFRQFVEFLKYRRSVILPLVIAIIASAYLAYNVVSSKPAITTVSSAAKSSNSSSAVYGNQGEELIEAAGANDLAKVRKLLDSGVNADSKDKNGFTALMWAAHKGNLDMVKTILEKGANVNSRDENGATALMYAAWSHRDAFYIVEILSDKGANVNAEAQDGMTALHHAASKGHTMAVVMLLKKGADVNARTQTGVTPLMVAALKNHDTVASMLLAKGADMNL